MAKYQDDPAWEAEKADFFAKFNEPAWRGEVRSWRVWFLEDKQAFGLMIVGVTIWIGTFFAYLATLAK